MDFPRDFGGYRLLAEIGRGGNGVVYRAEQLSLGRTVALKVLRESTDWENDENYARFQREGQVMARLTHPDIVAVYDHGKIDGRLYIAMEFAGGLTLDRWFETGFPPPEDCLRVVARIARALHYAHQNGVVHRDIKPTNIVVDHAGNPKLTDFGLAKVEGTKLTQTHGLLGTPLYMSPEQASGRLKHLDARSDIYSLGSVMYELLAGTPPFTGTTIETILSLVAHGEPVGPRVMNPRIPRDVETICLRAMARLPVQRYATAEELADDIERFLRGEPIRARRPSTIERMLRWSRRHRAMAVVSLILSLLALAGGGVTFHLLRKLREQQESARQREALVALAADADAAYHRRDYGRAFEALARLRGTVHDQPDRQLRRAVSLRELRRYDEAEHGFDAYVRLTPDDAAGWRHRGLNALHRDDLRLAILCYTQAAKLAGVGKTKEASRNEDWDALIALVEGHFRIVEPQHARPFLAEYYPEYFAPAYRELGLVVISSTAPPNPYGLGVEWKAKFETLAYVRLDKVSRWFDEYGNHPAVLAWRAYLNGEASDRAIDDLNLAIELLPISRGLRHLRLFHLRKLGRMEEADREWEKIRALAPADPLPRFNFAIMCKKAGEHLRASRLFEELADDQRAGRVPGRVNSPYAHLMDAARCAALAGDVAETLRLLRKVVGYNMGLRRSDIEENAEFKPVLDRPEIQEFLQSLPS
ncbi:MAG: protein kinase [Planctomycetes bacterium]|nr:protein kinase [Planctomycetota bacterium]